MRFSWLFRHKILREGIYKSVEMLIHEKPRMVLDIGCGQKRYQKLFKSAKYIGIDIPFSNSEGNIADVYGNALALPFKKNVFDYVISTEVIEHVSDPGVFMQQIREVLTPGGRLLLSAPFFWPLHEEPYDFYRYTIHGFKELLQRQGFVISEIIKRGGFASVIVQLAGDFFQSNNKTINAILDVLFGFLQASALVFDRIFPSKKYALGWTIITKNNENTYH